MFKKTVTTTKEIVKRNKTAIAIVATTVVLTTIHVKIIDTHNEFLKEHDLFDKFYTMDEED